MQIVDILSTKAPLAIGRNLEIYGSNNVPLSILEPNGLYSTQCCGVLGPKHSSHRPNAAFSGTMWQLRGGIKIFDWLHVLSIAWIASKMAIQIGNANR